MSAKPHFSTEDLLSSMLNLPLFVVLSKGKGLDVAPHLREHLEYMIHLESEGKLFASGPLGTPGTGDGLTILRVATNEEAIAIAEADPFVRHGLRDFSISPWRLMEGALNISVQLSQGASQLK